MKKDSKVNRVNEYIDYLTDPIFEAVVLGPKIKSQVRNVKLLFHSSILRKRPLYSARSK